MNKRRLIIIAALSILAAACDSELSREYGEPQTHTTEITCSYTAPGYCMDCGMGFDGKMDCMPKLKPLCQNHGTKMAVVEDRPVTIYMESGKVISKVERRVIKSLSTCK